MSEYSKKIVSNGLPVMLMATLSLSSSFIGIFNQQLYGIGKDIGSLWFSQNVVTLLLAIPALMLFFHASFTKHILKARIILLGIIGYFIYSSVFYVFASDYNILYFINLPLLSISVYSFVDQFPKLNEHNVQVSVPSKQIMYAVTVYLTFISFLIFVYWSSTSWSSLSASSPQQAMFGLKSGSTIFSLDVGFVIPLIIFGVIKMWKGSHTGYLIVGMMLVLATMLGFLLIIRIISQINFKLEGFDIFTAIILINGLVGFLLTFMYFKYLEVVPKRTVKITREIPNKLLFRTQVMNN